MSNISKQVKENDAVRSTIDRFFPLNQGNIILKFIYALAITVVVVLIGWVLSRDEK